MDFSDALSVVFPVLTIIIGGACILLFSVTSTLRASNTDLRARVADLEAKETRDEATIKAQESEIRALQKVVTGADQLHNLSVVLDMHHTDSVATMARIESAVRLVVDKVVVS